MKAITLHAPWGTAIAECGKDIENRGHLLLGPRFVGQRIAIHQGQAWDSEAAEALAARGLAIGTRREDHATGAIVATARIRGIVDCRGRGGTGVPISGLSPGGGRALVHAWRRSDAGPLAALAASSPWWAGPVGIVLEDVIIPGTTIWCRGKQGAWDVPAEVLPLLAPEAGTPARMEAF